MAQSSVQFKNCRHPFGGALSYDVVVDGMYPRRHAAICLVQSDVRAVLNIPHPTTECAKKVIETLTIHKLCGVFKEGVIKVSLSWENAPSLDWEIILTIEGSSTVGIHPYSWGYITIKW